VQPHPDARGGRDDAAEDVAGAGREHVVVVGDGGAARAGEHGDSRLSARLDEVGVDGRPGRVERDEPVEEYGVLRPAAGEPLVEVVVGVDQPGGEQVAGAVDDLDDRARGERFARRAEAPHGPLGGGSPADADDGRVVDDDPAGRMLGAQGVDGGDGRPGDDGALHGGPPVRAGTGVGG
jgi:hypothetical protein